MPTPIKQMVGVRDYRTEAGSTLVNQLRRRCYIPIELP